MHEGPHGITIFKNILYGNNLRGTLQGLLLKPAVLLEVTRLCWSQRQLRDTLNNVSYFLKRAFLNWVFDKDMFFVILQTIFGTIF